MLFVLKLLFAFLSTGCMFLRKLSGQFLDTNRTLFKKLGQKIFKYFEAIQNIIASYITLVACGIAEPFESHEFVSRTGVFSRECIDAVVKL
jgi:hypothetical protein